MGLFSNIGAALKNLRFWLAVGCVVLAVIGAGSAGEKALFHREEWLYTAGIIVPLLITLGILFKRSIFNLAAFGLFVYLNVGVQDAQFNLVNGQFVGDFPGYSGLARANRDLTTDNQLNRVPPNRRDDLKKEAEQRLAGLILLIAGIWLVWLAVTPFGKIFRRASILSKKSLFGIVGTVLFLLASFVNMDNVDRIHKDATVNNAQVYFETETAWILAFSFFAGTVARSRHALLATAMLGGFVQTQLLSRAIKENGGQLDDGIAAANGLGWIAIVYTWVYFLLFWEDRPYDPLKETRDRIKRSVGGASKSGSSSSASASASSSASASASSSAASSASGSASSSDASSSV